MKIVVDTRSEKPLTVLVASNHGDLSPEETGQKEVVR